jgi:hypothetical protein
VVLSGGVAVAETESLAASVSGAVADMLLALVVEVVSCGEAANMQPLAKPAEIISDVIINARCHLFLFMFTLVLFSLGWKKTFVKLKYWSGTLVFNPARKLSM